MTAPVAPELSADTLAEAGAAPVEVNAAELLARIQAMQVQMDSLLAERGVPVDAMAAAVKDVQDHIAARVSSLPNRAEEFAELKALAKDLPEHPTSTDTELLRTVLDEVRGYAEGLDYIKELATGLHKRVLRAA